MQSSEKSKVILMSKLESLIQELCPDGVEYKSLKIISNMKRGQSLTKANAIEGDIPVISGGREPAFFCNTFNRQGETVTVAGSGAGAGFVQFFNNPIYANDCFTIKGINGISTKYLYYYLSNKQNYIYSTKKGGGVPHVHISDIENMMVPVPPLPVQEEIVKILDKMTDYVTELKAELKARNMQYEYYFKQVLTLYNSPMVKLGDIGNVKMCKRIMKAQTSSSGDVPFYKIGTFGKNPDSYISNDVYNEYVKKYSYPSKGDILISCSGTIGRTVAFDGKPAYFQDSNIVWLEHDGSKVINEYLRYAYMTNPWIISTGGTISRLYNDGILKAEIPLPTIKQQMRIVSILDRFDKICNDISSGLPAEIEARQKQYEYYRDKLLTFKEL